MKKNLSTNLICFVCILMWTGCFDDDLVRPTADTSNNETPEVPEPTLNYADIDFSNWKVTLPVDIDNNGSPDEYLPGELVDDAYRDLEAIKEFMYDDTSDGSIVFYTYPGVSTTNSSYSRTELRELINPDNARDNWSLSEGGEMVGTLKIDDVSEDNGSNNDYHRVIVMQIHGIISQQDMDEFGFSSNNGPPLLKMYWKNGFLWAHKKSLVDESIDGNDLLDTSSDTWTDIKHNFGYVGFEAFEFRITATAGKLELQLNNETPFVYEDVSLSKWPFENYFKAGNYLNSTNPDAYAYIKYYDLMVTH